MTRNSRENHILTSNMAQLCLAGVSAVTQLEAAELQELLSRLHLWHGTALY